MTLNCSFVTIMMILMIVSAMAGCYGLWWVKWGGRKRRLGLLVLARLHNMQSFHHHHHQHHYIVNIIITLLIINIIQCNPGNLFYWIGDGFPICPPHSDLGFCQERETQNRVASPYSPLLFVFGTFQSRKWSKNAFLSNISFHFMPGQARWRNLQGSNS